ncbi:unnamed protein product [Nippostrongylus brasiliensis]|uniref:BPTI/Kunitz inhibitor domain-containing protein n=1 Tax=Nippostrongylus brasiliensis TaxID=27835 RepID=A0A0N4YIL6_NIPBR|nr:unnamed protein product [Nippostrongylus brasiliensis]
MKHLWLLVILVVVAFASEDGKASEAEGTKEGDVCGLKLETGPCRAAFPKYGYSKEKKTCVQFTYGGCSGNGNNFKTLEECQKVCP